MGMGEEDKGGAMSSEPLFETRVAKGRLVYKLFASSMAVGICLILFYRIVHIPTASTSSAGERWVWVGMFLAELWFGLYWIITQSVRWNPVYRSTFKQRLSKRLKKFENGHEAGDLLPAVDVFVCTANPKLEPPSLVISTVLSVMAYDYPHHKLAVYLSDDGGSDLTFYALLEASRFAEIWVPFCQELGLEPRSPAAYFSSEDHHPPADDASLACRWLAVKRSFEEMTNRIEAAVEVGRVPDEIKEEHRGFSEWNGDVTPRDHQGIVQILIDGRRIEENSNLPTLVYMSREKRPHHHHNFKAGAMNALIRVSSEISNGPIVLNVDCDMYSNDSSSIREALCFFTDEREGDKIGFVQHPQSFNNSTKNDLYANAFKVINQVELPGLDGLGGVPYIGTGCFHRRESLCGSSYFDGKKQSLLLTSATNHRRNLRELEEEEEDKVKALVTCTFEDNTQWGKEVGVKYGCAVEDIITGLAVQCKGWRSVYLNPSSRPAFLGVAPTSLGQTMIQHKRWSEGHLQIFLSRYNSVVYGHGKIKLGLRLAYCIYGLWAPCSFPTLYYVIVPSLCLLRGTSLFPKMSSPWSVPLTYVIVMKTLYSLVESTLCNDTVLGWWNIQRMWLIKRTTSYLFGTVDVVRKLLGLSETTTFNVTAKVTEEGAAKRMEEEVMDFGGSPPTFLLVIATVALINLVCLVAHGLLTMERGSVEGELWLQVGLCGVVVALNMPVYSGLFFRWDDGSIPTSVMCKSVVLTTLVCLLCGDWSLAVTHKEG